MGAGATRRPWRRRGSPSESPALRRLVVQRLAERAAGGPLPLGADRMREIERLAARGGSGVAELGGGVRAVAEYGLVRFTRDAEATPPPAAELSVPGTCRFGDVGAGVPTGPAAAGAGTGLARRAGARRRALAATLTVRAWQDGDRMRPLGLGGSKSLQDLFSDRKVPRSLRHSLPVVVSGDEIAWIAGVAVSDLFKQDQRTSATMRLASACGCLLRLNS